MLKKQQNIIFIIICAFFIFEAGDVCTQNYETYKFYNKALREQISGKQNEAKKDYEQVISLDAEGALTAYKDLTYLDWQLGDKENALKLAEKINEIDGKNADTAFFLAGFYISANTTDSAKVFLDKTLKLDPENEAALSSLATFYLNNNNFKESARYWKEYLKLDPQSALGNFQYAYVQEQLGKNKEALIYYDKVIKSRPDVLDSYTAKARIYESGGKIKEAIKTYEDFYKEYPDNPFVLVYLGRLYYLNGDFEKSEEFLLKAKTVLTDDFNTAFWLAMLYERTGHIAQAIEEFEFIYALPSQKNNLIVISKLAYDYAVIGKFNKAAFYIEKALKQEPENVELLYFAALNYMDLKDFDQASILLNKVITLRASFSDAYLYLAAAYEKKGDWNSAQDTLIKAVMLFPNDARIMNYLGFAYAERGINLNDALALLERAVSLDKENGQYIDSLGWLYFKLGRFDIAERALVTAANMTRHPQVYHHLGDVYIAMGKNADAWTAYALSYDGYEDKSVKRKLDKTQRELSNSELADKMLFRVSSHYLKLFSLKTGFKVKADLILIDKTGAFFNFDYVKGEAILLSMQTPFMPSAKIYIKDGKIYFSPKILSESLPEEILLLINNAADILKSGFIESFKNTDIRIDGKMMLYNRAPYKMAIDIRTSLIKEIVKDDLIVEILEYRKFFASYLPARIRIKIPSKNLSFILEAIAFDHAKEHIVLPK